MFFLIALIFLVELIVLYIIVSFLLQKDMEILILTDKIQSANKNLKRQLNSIENIFADINLILRKKKERYEKKQKKRLFSRIINTIEWFIFLIIKKQNKKFIFGYKIAKYLSKELSITKHVL